MKNEKGRHRQAERDTEGEREDRHYRDTGAERERGREIKK